MAKFHGTKINPDRFSTGQIKFYLILLPVAIFMILPVIYVVNQAFKPIDELLLFPPRFLVQKPTADNFSDLWRTASTTGVPMTRYLFNSILVTILTVVLTIMITVSSAYVLSKKKLKANKVLLGINQAALMFVPIAVIIPRYFVITTTGMNDTMWAHIIPLLAMPVGLFLVKQFVDQVPDALIEAARIEGANDFKILTKIIMPLTKPAIATVAILTFQVVWNYTESSSLYISNETLKTFAFYLGSLTARAQGNAVAGIGMAAAASLILFIPNLIIFIIMQSNVMDTMGHSGIK